MCVYWKVGRWKGEGKHGRKSSGQPEAGVSGNCLPGAVCVLFCADEHVCTFGGRSAIDAEELFRNLVAALAAVVLLLRAGEPFRIRRENLPYFLMRSIFGTMGVLCNFYAVDHLVLADASILNKMSPFLQCCSAG